MESESKKKSSVVRKSSQGKGSVGNRVKGASLVRPIVYGNISFYLNKSEEGKTHKWVCYLRGLHNEDISSWIKKVIFQLHPSFPNSKRVVEEFPFEIEEIGWGEFEVAIKIFFKDPLEKPVDVFHPLKLYPIDGIPDPNKPVVSEHYEEIVFNQPREEFYKILTEKCDETPQETNYSAYFGKFDEEKELEKIFRAQEIVKREIEKVKEQYEMLDHESEALS